MNFHHDLVPWVPKIVKTSEKQLEKAKLTLKSEAGDFESKAPMGKFDEKLPKQY
jgi:hypothetical protein